MTRLSAVFEQLRARGEGALIAYVMAGDPNNGTTLAAVRALEKAGVDAIELGLPFTDPLADGPVIQAAAQRALQNHMTVERGLELTAKIRAECDIPVVLMTYHNPVLQYGLERFARDAATAGADGVIQTDLPPEEAADWQGAARNNDLDTVFLLAPTSTQERLEAVSQVASGFIYCVSRNGITGANAGDQTKLPARVARIQSASGLPTCVGFGISRADQVQSICGYADGVVIGSAIVACMSEHPDLKAMSQALFELVCPLKQATWNVEPVALTVVR